MKETRPTSPSGWKVLGLASSRNDTPSVRATGPIYRRGGVTTGHPHGATFLVAAATLLGYSTHLAMDALNVTAMPVLWPVSRLPSANRACPNRTISGGGSQEALSCLLGAAALVHWGLPVGAHLM